MGIIYFHQCISLEPLLDFFFYVLEECYESILVWKIKSLAYNVNSMFTLYLSDIFITSEMSVRPWWNLLCISCVTTVMSWQALAICLHMFPTTSAWLVQHTMTINFSSLFCYRGQFILGWSITSLSSIHGVVGIGSHFLLRALGWPAYVITDDMVHVVLLFEN